MYNRTIKGIRADLKLTQLEMANILGISLRAYRCKELQENSFTQLEMIKFMLYANLSDVEAGQLFLSRSNNLKLYKENGLDFFIKK